MALDVIMDSRVTFSNFSNPLPSVVSYVLFQVSVEQEFALPVIGVSGMS